MNAVVRPSSAEPTQASESPSVAIRSHNGARPMIVIDGFNLSLEKGTGVATYARNLSFGLRDLGCDVGVLYGGRADRRHSALLKEVSFYDPQNIERGSWRELARRVRWLLKPNWNRAFAVPMSGVVINESFRSRLPHYDTIWNATDLFGRAGAQFELLGAVNRVSLSRRPDLCHWTYPLPLRCQGVPNIYTLHDLVPLRLPYSTLDKKDRYLKLLNWIARTADHIVTVSEASRNDIIDVLGVAPDRVTNTYQAVSIPDKYRLKPAAAVRGEVEGIFKLPFKDYYLFFGSIEPKKNIGRLIESYLASGAEGPLVIVGAQAWKSEQELKLLKSLDAAGRGGKIVRLEYTSLSMLVSLIRGAKAVLFPSLYEGFGLPVLEAMLLGTPVLTSKTSSLPEVAGDAALFVDPYDDGAIAQAIRVLDGDEALRAELTERGLVQAAKFSEAAYRQRLADVYNRVLTRA